MKYGTVSRVTKGLFVPTGTYNDMPNRPYETSVGIEEIMKTQEATKGGTSISAGVLGGIAGTILRPTTQAQGIVGIANGWDTPRLRFMLEIEHTGPGQFGEKTIQYLCGYTNYIGVIRAGGFGTEIVDPKMTLTFNQSVTTRVSTERTTNGIIERVGVSDASHILAGTYQPTFDNSGPMTSMMRPEDVFSTISLGVLGDVSGVLDTRNKFADEQIKKSRRSNSNASHYLASILKANNLAMQCDGTNGTDIAGVMDEARGQVMEPLIAEDLYLSRLAHQTSLSVGSTLTWGELCAFDPSFDAVVRIELNSPGAVVTDHSRGSTEYWHGQDPVTLAATTLGQAVPGIMAELMLLGVHFHATNATLDGSIYVHVSNYHSFAENLDLTPYLERFKARLEHEILRNLSHNNQVPFNVEYNSDLLGETAIKMSFNNSPMTDYCAPSFCDGLFPPVLTQQDSVMRTLASDIESLAGNLAVSHTAPAGAPTSPIYTGAFNGHQSSI